MAQNPGIKLNVLSDWGSAANMFADVFSQLGMAAPGSNLQVTIAAPTGVGGAMQFASALFTPTGSSYTTAFGVAPASGAAYLVSTDWVPYKSYVALISQAAGAAPTATVLANTLGGTVVLARTGAGVYTAVLTGAFVANKTYIGQARWFDAAVGAIKVDRTDANTLTITTFSPVPAAADSIMTNFSLEIRVYP